MKISSRLLILIFSIVVLSSVSHLMLNRLHDRTLYDQTELILIKNATFALKETLVRDIIDENRLKVTDTLRKLVSSEKIFEFIFITHNEHEIFAHSFTDGFPRYLVENKHRHEGLSEEVSLLIKYKTDDGIVSEYAISLIGGLNFHLHIGINQSLITEQLKKHDRQLLMMAITIIVFSSIIALFFSRRLVKPLSQLTDIFQQFGFNLNVDLSKLDSSLKEIKELKRILQIAIADRKKAHDELESRVEERTEKLRLEIEERKAAEIRAIEANNSKSLFLANMSHELRTPMHAIQSFTSLALKKAEDNKQIRFLQNARSSAIRLTSLLDDLLDLSKLEAGKMQATFIEQDLTTLAQDAISEVDSLLEKKDIVISFNTDVHYDCILDHKLMMQVFINLLSNAIKFSPESSIIYIEISSINKQFKDYQRQFIKVAIVDQGIGIPDDELESIFDKFIQSSKTKSQAGGTGLGLPITKEIVALHHGEIWVESPPYNRDSGTAFYFEIPVLQDIDSQMTFTNKEDAIKTHLEWRKVIDEMIGTQEIPQEASASLISNEHLCSLGQWIDALDIESDNLAQLEEAHRDFHFLAAECVVYCNENDMTKAKEAQNKFHLASDNIIQLLNDLDILE